MACHGSSGARACRGGHRCLHVARALARPGASADSLVPAPVRHSERSDPLVASATVQHSEQPGSSAASAMVRHLRRSSMSPGSLIALFHRGAPGLAYRRGEVHEPRHRPHVARGRGYRVPGKPCSFSCRDPRPSKAASGDGAAVMTMGAILQTDPLSSPGWGADLVLPLSERCSHVLASSAGRGDDSSR